MLNFPNIASPTTYTVINDEWMANMCVTTKAYLEGSPYFTVQMFCKFLSLLHTLLTCLKKEKREDPVYYRYHFGPQQLAWDLNVAPFPPQVHGLYQKFRVLHNHFVEAFEGMKSVLSHHLRQPMHFCQNFEKTMTPSLQG